MKFPERYSGAKVYKIETNYRSTPQILDVANAAISFQRPKAIRYIAEHR